MGAFSGPETVDTGLELCFDAGNTKSYPGSGTSWTDIGGGGYSESLYGGANVTYVSSDGGGCLDFATAAITDTAYIGVPTSFAFTSADNGTWEWWVKWRSGGRTGINGIAGVGTTNPWYLITVTSATSWVFQVRDTTAAYNAFANASPINLSNWTHLVLTVNTSLLATLYINGAYHGQLTYGGTGAFNMRRIMGGYVSGSNQYNWDGRMAISKFYRQLLTADDVSQNFNAHRGRFGV